MSTPAFPRPRLGATARLAPLALLAAALAASGPVAAASPEAPQAYAALQSRPAAVPAPQPGGGWGALYAAGASYGLAVNRADRDEARRAALLRCARQGQDCVLAAEFSGRCGAVAQAVDRGVLAAARPLGAGSIRATVAGAGETQEQALMAAQAACHRQAQGVCVVVAAACNAP